MWIHRNAAATVERAWKGIDAFRATYKKETMPKSAVVCRTSHAYPVRKTDWCRPLTGKDGILAIMDSI
ncbi:MAG: hypothetical protein ACOY3I_06085 [Verrucomicrobiota bacterium]